MAKYTLQVDQGSTYKLVLYWNQPLRDPDTDEALTDDSGDSIPGAPVNLYEFEGRMHIRKAIADAATLLELTSNPAAGIVIPATATQYRDLTWCVAATTGDITLSAPQTIDGVAVVAGDRVLVKNQTLSEDNGIYVVAAGAWSRASDADQAADLTEDALTWVREGTQAGSWTQTLVVTTLGTDPQTWVKTSDPGRIEVTITATQTAALTTSGVYDLELESSAGEVTRVLEGKMRLSAEVTR